MNGLRKRFKTYRVVLMAASAWMVCVVSAQEMDPATQPLPSADFANPGRGVVVKVLLDADGTAQHLGSLVSNVPPRGHAGDPPLLWVEWGTASGALLGAHNSWDPRWEFEETSTGGERKNDLAQADGAFAVPFHPNLSWVRISDQRTSQELITVDVSVEVQAFCDSQVEECDEVFWDGFEIIE